MKAPAAILGCLAFLSVSAETQEPDARKLVSDLGNPSFAVREAAHRRLAGDGAIPLGELLAELDTTRDEEIRLRLSEIVAAKRFPAALVEVLALSEGPEPVLVLGQRLLKNDAEPDPLGQLAGRYTVSAEHKPAGIEAVTVCDSPEKAPGRHTTILLSPPRRGPVYAALDDLLIRVEGISPAQTDAVKPLVCDPGYHARRTGELRSEIASLLKRGTLPVQPPMQADSGHADYSFPTVLAAASRVLKDPFVSDAVRRSLVELLAIDPQGDRPFARRWERDLLCLAETLCDLGDPRDAPLLAELTDASPAMGGLVMDAAVRYLSRTGLKKGNVLAAALLQCRHPAGSRLAACRSLAENAKVPLPEPLVCDQMVIALCDVLELPHGDFKLSRFEEILLKDAKTVPEDVFGRIEAARLRRDRGEWTWIYTSEADRAEGIARMLKRIELGVR